MLLADCARAQDERLGLQKLTVAQMWRMAIANTNNPLYGQVWALRSWLISV